MSNQCRNNSANLFSSSGSRLRFYGVRILLARFVCVFACRTCPCAVWGPHCGFLFLPTNLSLSSLCFCSFTLPPPLFKLPYTPFSLFAGQEEVNNMTFSRSDNILPHEFPTAPAFISHSHQFVFAPGSSVFPRNDHPGTRWLTSSTRGQGASRASAGSHIGKPHRR